MDQPSSSREIPVNDVDFANRIHIMLSDSDIEDEERLVEGVPWDKMEKRKTCYKCPSAKERKTQYKCVQCNLPKLICLECSRKELNTFGLGEVQVTETIESQNGGSLVRDLNERICAAMEVKPLERTDSQVLPHQEGDLRSSGSTDRGSKQLKCDVCDYVCNRLHNLKIHKLVHSGVKSFKCDVCDYASKYPGNLKTHKLVHTGDTPYKCSSCDYAGKRLSDLKRHKLVHRTDMPHKCDACDFSTHMLRYLKAHKRLHSGVKIYKCDVCEYTHTKMSKLNVHKLVHSAVKLYQCDACDYSCNKLCDFKLHKLAHIGVRLYGCDECGYTCNKLSKLQTHKLVHSGVKLHKCDVCKYACNRLDRLKAHRLKAHKLSQLGDSDTALTQTGDVNKYQYCSEENFSSQVLGTQHRCIDCEYYFKSLAKLKEHLFLHCDLS